MRASKYLPNSRTIANRLHVLSVNLERHTQVVATGTLENAVFPKAIQALACLSYQSKLPHNKQHSPGDSGDPSQTLLERSFLLVKDPRSNLGTRPLRACCTKSVPCAGLFFGCGSSGTAAACCSSASSRLQHRRKAASSQSRAELRREATPKKTGTWYLRARQAGFSLL